MTTILPVLAPAKLLAEPPLRPELLAQLAHVRALLADELAAAPHDHDACLTCSFQAEDVLLLKLVQELRPRIHVLFLDTGYHFAQTYAYRDQLALEWNLSLTNLLPATSTDQQESQFGLLHQVAPDRCCGMRKVEPLFAAVAHYKLWLTGLRREQARSRTALEEIADFKLPSGVIVRKLSPFADWSTRDVWQLASAFAIPLLPLYQAGYTSIGCEPCTSLPTDPNDSRSGRWAGRKVECGIHIQADEIRAAHGESLVMEYIIGFVIAIFIALTGVGAGTITTPLLILFLGIPTATAVSTGLMFSTVVKLVLVPSQIARKQVNWRVLGWMLVGGLPGVLLGSFVLVHLASAGSRQLTNSILGMVLVATAIYQIRYSFRPIQKDYTKPDRRRWMPLLMFPVGAEVGFSSAGAGALGTAALLSLTDLLPAQVVGTDILFGFLLSLVGSGAHWFSHSTNPALLTHLVLGGIVGVLVGTASAKFIPRRPLRFALWVWLLVIGSQVLYTSGGPQALAQMSYNLYKSSAPIGH